MHAPPSVAGCGMVAIWIGMGYYRRVTVLLDQGLWMNIFRGPVFRHIPEERYADQFVTGESIWVSTFQRCREYEDKEQGDAGEGTMLHHIKHASSRDQGFESIARQYGIVSSGGGTITMTNTTGFHVVDDAYVVCFSMGVFGEDLMSKFGRYPVKVLDIELFARYLEFEMRKYVPTVRYGLGLGPVTYAERFYQGYDSPPSDIHFVKPEHPFKIQREYRVVIKCEPGHKYQPFAVNVPLPRGLCVPMYRKGV
jgi:hypothetical protein